MFSALLEDPMDDWEDNLRDNTSAIDRLTSSLDTVSELLVGAIPTEFAIPPAIVRQSQLRP